MLCQVCQIPMLFTEPGDPTKICQRHVDYQGESFTSAPTAASGSSSASRRSTCRRGCRCTRSTRATAAVPTIPEVLDWYGMEDGDGGEYQGSLDAKNWDKWHNAAGHS